MKEDEKKLEELLDELIIRRKEETDALKKLIESINQGEENVVPVPLKDQQVKKKKKNKKNSKPNI
jgi:hypothetical protein